MTEETIADRIEAYRSAIQSRCDDDTTITVEYARNWAKVIRSGKFHRSVHSFVALKASNTKSLGQVVVGDIHKADSWKKPARHARGTVWADDFSNCYSSYGVAYLR